MNDMDNNIIQVTFLPAVTLEVASDGTVRLTGIDWSDSLSNGWDPTNDSEIDVDDPRCELAAKTLDTWIASGVISLEARS